MPSHNKVFQINLDLTGPNAPAWGVLSDEDWQSLLSNYLFLIADGFAFGGVFKKADLFVYGITYFSDWALDSVTLAETEDDIVCVFNLNKQCQEKLLEYEFSIHEVQTNELLTNCEFDSLYFFSGNRMIGHYIHHESEIIFYLNDQETAMIDHLPLHLKANFTDHEVIMAFWEARRNNAN